MENQTPITISSVSAVSLASAQSVPFLQCVYDKSPEVISLDSSSTTMRCPVTWNNNMKKPKHDSLGFATPSVNDRVQAWMRYTTKEDTNEQIKNSVLVRRDFNKVVKEDDIEIESNIKHVTSLRSYLENNMKAKISGRKTPNHLNDLDPIKRLETATYEYEMQLMNSGSKPNIGLKNGPKRFAKDSPQTVSTCNSSSFNEDSRNSIKDSEIYEVPLSPESQKKELCTYLQLMNPADKKETLLLQNRRSVRVRNLNILMEKKQLEQQLKKKSEELHNHSTHNNKRLKTSTVSLIEIEDSLDSYHPTLKSFRDLSMQVPYVELNRFDKKSHKASKKKKNSIVLTIPLQAEKQIDFDDIYGHWKNLEGLESNSETHQEIKAVKQNNNTNSESKINLAAKKQKNIKLKPKSNSQSKENVSTASKVDINKQKKKNKRRLLRRLSNPEKLRALRSGNNLRNKSIENLIIERRLRNSNIRKQLRLKKVSKKNAVNKQAKVKTVKDNINDTFSESAKIDDQTHNEGEIRKLENNVDVLFEAAKTDSVEIPSEPVLPSCEIVSFIENLEENHDDEIYLRQFTDELDDLNYLSEEHRKILIESRIISRKTPQENLNNFVHRETPQENLNNVLQRQTLSVVGSEKHFDRNSLKSPAVSSVRTNSSLAMNGHDDRLNYLKSPYKDVLYKVDYTQKTSDTVVNDVSANDNCDSSEFVTEEREIIYAPQKDSEIIENNIAGNECLDKMNTLSPVRNDLLLTSDLDSVQELRNSPIQQKKLPEEGDENQSSYSDFDESSSSSVCSHPVSVRSNIPIADHDYIDSPSDDSDSHCSSIPSPKYEKISTNDIELKHYPLIPLTQPLQRKSLFKSLTQVKRKPKSISYSIEGPNSDYSWSSDSEIVPEKQILRNKSLDSSHFVNISPSDGAIFKAFYIDDHLVICQEYQVSLWHQSALGRILGAQNMWVPKGKVRRLVLTDNSVQKDSSEMVISMENTLAYVELWTKEHKSEIREGPVADVFATIYFWRKGQSGLEKKVLQLENINGFSDDVQYVVLKSSQRIVVSWHSVTDCSKGTNIHAYELAADYQTVENISEIEGIKHYVSSLHNIEDCESLLMGCGENKITLWNMDYGYIISTIELTNIKSALVTSWVKCIRGYLFTIQQCVDGELRLIAINGSNERHTWKKLQSFNPPPGFDRLKGVTIENGILVSFYDQGILCWNAQTGDPVVEEIPNETDYIPSGEFVIMNIDGKIIVRHALTHLIVTDDS